MDYHLHQYADNHVNKLLDSMKINEDNDLNKKRLISSIIDCFHIRKQSEILFYSLFENLSIYLPNTMAEVCEFIPIYGCWSDMFVLISRSKINKNMIELILQYITRQIEHEYFSADFIKESVIKQHMPCEGEKLYKDINQSLQNHGYKFIDVEIVNRLDNDLFKNIKGHIKKKYRDIISLLPDAKDSGIENIKISSPPKSSHTNSPTNKINILLYDIELGNKIPNSDYHKMMDVLKSTPLIEIELRQIIEKK